MADMVADLSVREEDPVLAALMRAPLDDLPESEEERRAVAAAKASHRMKPHAAIESAITMGGPESPPKPPRDFNVRR
jgi:hypothetical protein